MTPEEFRRTIEKLARQELADEEFRENVEKRKAELREQKSRSLIQRIFPFKIKIERI